MNPEHKPTCCCGSREAPAARPAGNSGGVRKTARPAGSVLMSIGIAFFPKCPLCWAAYMSLFSSIGLARIPYLKWLLPVLLAFLLLHLYLIFKKVKEKGYGPFLCSLAGAATIIVSRQAFPDVKQLACAGIALILAGSLWNSFSPARMKPALY